MMRRLVIMLCCVLTMQLSAQRINRNYNNVPISAILKQMNNEQNKYIINFIYDELEDFRVTSIVRNQNVPDAIQQLIGFYPIKMSTVDDNIILVECVHKTDTRYKGRIIDELGQPAEYANISLLSPIDSTVICTGVSNESGYFVIPCELQKVIVRITYVGYKTIMRVVNNTDMGVIRIVPDKYTIQGITVKGQKTILRSEADRIQYIVAADSFARGLNGVELLTRVPLLNGNSDALPAVIGKSSTHYMLNGRELPANIQLSKIRSLKAEDIERVEVIIIPPSKHRAEANAGYVNIVTNKDQTLGVQGDVIASVSHYTKWREMVNGSLNYATKRLNVSWNNEIWNANGINDHISQFIFADHMRTTDFQRTFQWLMPSSNMLAQYKATENINIGFLGSISTNCMKTQQTSTTIELGKTTYSTLSNPVTPNFNLSAEAYMEWKIDSMGKTVNLTYDYLNNYSKQEETIISENEDAIVGNMTLGDARYRIDSWKLDFALPFRAVMLEIGLAYTYIMNKSCIESFNQTNNIWYKNITQTNDYQYKERTAAAYTSVSKKWERVSLKAGMRLEKTWAEGLLLTNNEKNRNDYLRLFPTLHINWRVAARSSLGLAYSMGISRPDFQDLNPFRYYYTSTSYFEGNPSLRPSITNNVEINFSNSTGIYAVLYENHEKNGISSYSSFSETGDEVSTVANCLVSDKTGLYVSYSKDLMPWWNIRIGGEVFHYYSKSVGGFSDLKNCNEWSGKIEYNQTTFLNKQHTLAFELYYNHLFPHSSRGAHFKTVVLFGGNIRYSMLNDRLKFRFSFSDPFNQNVSRSVTHYDSFAMNSSTNAHSSGVSLSVSYSFGGNNVRRVYHQSKNTDSSRAGMRN